MTGGVISDGTYVLTSYITYGGGPADNSTYKETILFAGNTMQAVLSLGTTDQHVTFAIAPAGNQLNEALSCPSAGAMIATDYTATPTSFIFVNHGDSAVQTYTKL